MRSRLFSFAPSLRIEMVSSMLRSNTSWHYCGILIIPCSTGPPHDGTRQQDQVGWSEGGPHIVIRQYTFVDGAWAREGSRPMAGPSISRTKIIIFFAPQ